MPRNARAKRLAAEAEEKTAKAEKDTATTKQIEANRHKQTALAEAANARDAKVKAEAADGTAVARKNVRRFTTTMSARNVSPNAK